MESLPTESGLTLWTPVWAPRKWRVVYRRQPDLWADCNHSDRTITLDPDMTPAEQILVMPHEGTHAAEGYEEDRCDAVGKSNLACLRFLIDRYGLEEICEAITENPQWRRKAKRKRR